MTSALRFSSSSLNVDAQNSDITQMMKEDLSHIISSVQETEQRKVHNIGEIDVEMSLNMVWRKKNKEYIFVKATLIDTSHPATQEVSDNCARFERLFLQYLNEGGHKLNWGKISPPREGMVRWHAVGVWFLYVDDQITS